MSIIIICYVDGNTMYQYEVDSLEEVRPEHIRRVVLLSAADPIIVKYATIQVAIIKGVGSAYYFTNGDIKFYVKA